MKYNNVYEGDCLELLKQLPDNSINLIVTSPPYNKGFWSSNRNMKNGFNTKSRRIEYGTYDDCVNPDEYEAKQRAIITECLRVLTEDGSLFYNHVPIQKLHQEILPLYVYDFPVKQTIIWNRKNTPKLDKSYFFPTIEFIYWIQKTSKSRTKFNRKKALFNKVIWDLSPDAKNNFPAPFPRELADNCILTCTDEGDVVLDIFAGSGTTLLSAKALGRKYLGFEIDKKYVYDMKKLLKRSVK